MTTRRPSTMVVDEEEELLDLIRPMLSRDLREVARTLSPREIRYLVDFYYMTQENRKSLDNQVRQMATEPHTLIAWFGKGQRITERLLPAMFGIYAQEQPVGRWALSICGIGPVIAAGLMARIDIEKAPTVGHIWRFAGLDPTTTWNKGEKRPWNASLKTLCFKIGESFVKVSGRPQDIYGKLYLKRKAYEQARNEAGELAGQATAKLTHFKIGEDTEAYKAYIQGRLPLAHIHARARRWTVKVFLAHYHHVAYEVRFGEPPPLPFILTQPAHTHFIKPPNWPME